MPQVRIMEETGSLSQKRIWEGALPEAAIGSRLSIEPSVTERLGETEMRVEVRRGSDWLDIGAVEELLPEICSLEAVTAEHDDIMAGWHLEYDYIGEDYAGDRLQERMEAAAYEATQRDRNDEDEDVLQLRRLCRYCDNRVEGPFDLVCSDCLAPPTLGQAHYCAGCDKRLRIEERPEGYCASCGVLYDISPSVELMSRYRPFGRSDRRVGRTALGN